MKPLYSIIIPAYNEESWLPKSLSRLTKCMQCVPYPGEIIVIDNNSTDQTSAIARQYTKQVFFEPVNQISRARNKGAKKAAGAYLIFLDADSFISSELLQSALDNLIHKSICGGGAVVIFDDMSKWLTKKSLHLWTYVQKKLNLAAGCFVYCTQQAFNEVGGFSQKVYASEEIWFSLKLKRWGEKKNLSFKIIEAYPILSSSRKMNHPFRLIITSLGGILFPFAIFFRSLCWFWYKRPNKLS